MNDMQKSVELMDDIMDQITQTDMWNRIQLNDPMIQDADRGLTDCLNTLKGTLSERQVDEIRSAAWGLVSASNYSAILYGMRVAQAIQDVSANPAALSQCILNWMAAVRAKQPIGGQLSC